MAKNKTYLNRRNFIKKSSSVALAVPLMPLANPFNLKYKPLNKGLQVHLFSKHLQFLDYDEMAKVASEIGFDGLDLTVRPKGHVLPENVARDLPKAVVAMKKHGLKSTMITTNVLDGKNVTDRQLLETASGLGVSHYRTGWLSYPEDRNIEASQKIYRKLFSDLESVNENLDLVGCYQNHAGNHVGAPIWDMPPILPSSESKYMGCQYDIRHAVAEGGLSWELDLRLIAPYIRSIIIKDFKWGMKEGKWQPINTPLGEGMVNFTRYFSLLKKYKINVPVSLHLEYDLGGAEHGASEITINREEVYAKMKKDLVFLRDTWSKAE
ncbi:sugar phosphate isomerase/epimerase family protein [Zobellia alginiliquefaciens]|uniref:sugar phosphate isomerase/epimerase family protein n=1 Tax=Zobellia alginiliquefaciens TaxID=3032586 RepID=UPI0023E45030|nr:TIM barrel protein [Zobellia alginiliquefaciens]